MLPNKSFKDMFLIPVMQYIGNFIHISHCKYFLRCVEVQDTYITDSSVYFRHQYSFWAWKLIRGSQII